jgi:glycosyltransferase involved in cell wall biosynthesis
MSAGEALARARPVIVSESVGIAPLVREYGCGWVVPADAGAVAAAMNTAVQPDALLGLRESAAAAAQAELTFSAYARAMASVHARIRR